MFCCLGRDKEYSEEQFKQEIENINHDNSQMEVSNLLTEQGSDENEEIEEHMNEKILKMTKKTTIRIVNTGSKGIKTVYRFVKKQTNNVGQGVITVGYNAGQGLLTAGVEIKNAIGLGSGQKQEFEENEFENEIELEPELEVEFRKLFNYVQFERENLKNWEIVGSSDSISIMVQEGSRLKQDLPFIRIILTFPTDLDVNTFIQILYSNDRLKWDFKSILDYSYSQSLTQSNLILYQMVCKMPFPYKNRQFSEFQLRTFCPSTQETVILYGPYHGEDKFPLNNKYEPASTIIGANFIKSTTINSKSYIIFEQLSQIDVGIKYPFYLLKSSLKQQYVNWYSLVQDQISLKMKEKKYQETQQINLK